MIRSIDNERRQHFRVFLDEEVPVSVIFAEKEIPLTHLLNYSEGSVIFFDDVQPEQLELRVGNTRVGAGRAVTVGERLGLQLSEVSDRRALAALVVDAEVESGSEAETVE